MERGRERERPSNEEEACHFEECHPCTKGDEQMIKREKRLREGWKCVHTHQRTQRFTLLACLFVGTVWSSPLPFIRHHTPTAAAAVCKSPLRQSLGRHTHTHSGERHYYRLLHIFAMHTSSLLLLLLLLEKLKSCQNAFPFFCPLAP